MLSFEYLALPLTDAVNVEWDDRSGTLDMRYFPVEKEIQLVVYCRNGRMAGDTHVHYASRHTLSSFVLFVSVLSEVFNLICTHCVLICLQFNITLVLIA